LEPREASAHSGCTAWTEDPPSRTRHLITNIRVVDAEGGELKIASRHVYLDQTLLLSRNLSNFF
jgi:3-phenylpropionate/cinnamic acid dioxygenase small subunit